jgi:ribosomal protein S18 acetylase RimI-like enzyme
MVSIAKITDPQFAASLHEILREAFGPFRDYYTKEAFAATVVSVEIITDRIASTLYTVYGGFVDDQLAGTVTTKLTGRGELHFMTMAVSSRYAGMGLGKKLLSCIEDEAIAKQCPAILLETYEPLERAIHLYEANGYRRTGMKRDYSGIEVFEMKKEL